MLIRNSSAPEPATNQAESTRDADHSIAVASGPAPTSALRRIVIAGIAATATIGLVLSPSVTTSANAAAPTAASATVTAKATTGLKATASPKKTSRANAIVKLKLSKKRVVQGKRGAKLTVRVKARGKKASGTVRLFDGKRHLTTKRLVRGKASYRLPRSLKPGSHRLTAKFAPSRATVRSVRPSHASIRVRVISRSALIVTEAKKHVGIRYRSGGTTPSGFDCSGFTRYVYKKTGLKNLPASSSAQRFVGKRISRANAKPGDLIWSPGHVGIYLGGNKQIDAPRPGKTIQVRAIWQSNPTFIRV